MKRIIITFTLLLTIMSAWSQTGRFSINGNIRNLPDSSVLVLYKSSGNLLVTVVQDTVINGTFHFSDTISGPPTTFSLCGVSENLPHHLVDIWVAPGAKVDISGEGVMYPFWHYESNIPLQKSSNEFINVIKPVLAEELPLSIEERPIYRRLSMTEETPSDSLISRIKYIQNKRWELINNRQKKTLEYMAVAPIDRVWLEKMEEFAKHSHTFTDPSQIDLIKSLYKRLSPEDLASESGEIIESYMNIDKIIGVGDHMADAVLYDTDGGTHSLSELLNGRYLLLDFWSQGCGPCVQSIPEMNELEKEYAGSLVVVGICNDEKELWKNFLEKFKPSGHQWNQLSGGKASLTTRYGVSSIPSYVLISPDGRIISKWEGYGKNSLKEKIASLVPRS